MAIWQWEMWLLPKKELEKNFPSVPEYLDLDWFENIDWWQSANVKAIETFFDSLLPRYNPPWAANSRGWGSDDKDRLTVSLDNNKVAGVTVRLDLRNLNLTLLKALIDFCNENDYVFFTLDTNKFVESNLSELLENIINSRKMNYVNDPKSLHKDKGYLDKLNKEIRRKHKK